MTIKKCDQCGYIETSPDGRYEYWHKLENNMDTRKQWRWDYCSVECAIAGLKEWERRHPDHSARPALKTDYTP